MNLGKKTITAVILIATSSLLGLSWVQFNWLKESIDTNRKIFYQKVDLATDLARKEARKDVYLLNNVVQEIQANSKLSLTTENHILAIIDTVLDRYNIRTEYTYGLYEHVGDNSPGFKWIAGTSPDLGIISLDCGEERTFGWANLTCQNSESGELYRANYHLSIFFPEVDLFLLSTVKGTLFTSFLFICLLIGCFAYTILTIRKQKRLSIMKNDFINNLTHEFKTPIFSIDLASNILKKAPELQGSDKLLRYVDVIENEGKRLRSQVDKVLQMALVDSGNFKLEKKHIDIHELISKVVKNFEMLVNERGGEIALNLLAKNTILFVDETHLKNILYNLLDNAQKYSANNPEIIITTADNVDGLRLSIQDNGIGIDEHIQQYVFDKFYRGDNSDIHNVKGFGLGLSYVKSVIDAHKANIDLISSPDTGSKFILEFYS
jgi:two-component system phosphate regulon sensor histidine kinase PhoR